MKVWCQPVVQVQCPAIENQDTAVRIQFIETNFGNSMRMDATCIDVLWAGHPTYTGKQPVHGTRPAWQKRFTQQFEKHDFQQNVYPSISLLDGYFLAWGRIAEPLEHALPDEPHGVKMTGTIGERSLNPKMVIVFNIVAQQTFLWIPSLNCEPYILHQGGIREQCIVSLRLFHSVLQLAKMMGSGKMPSFHPSSFVPPLRT